MPLKLLQKRAIQKTTGKTGDLVGNEIADKIIKVLITSPQNNLETVTNEEENIGLGLERPRERYISPEKKKQNY